MNKKLIVIGGTAAGLSAASKVKRLNPSIDISVYEKSGYVSYGSCGLPYFVGDMIKEPEDLVSLNLFDLNNKRNIPTWIHHEVTKINRSEKTVEVHNLDTDEVFTKEYDYLVIATGAVPVIPPIKGRELNGVYSLRTVEDGIRIKSRVQSGAKRAVIIGGGFIGLEMAEELTSRNIKVTAIEAMPRLMPSFNESFSQAVKNTLESHGVDVFTGISAEEILGEKGTAAGVKLNNGQTFPADFVLLCVGAAPNSKLAKDAGLKLGLKSGIAVDEHLKTSDDSIWACGDCVQMYSLITGQPVYFPLGTTANKQGRIAGSNIAGENTTFKGVLGSQVAKIFDLFVSSTGLTPDQAANAGFNPAASGITKLDKASYYPGGKENQLYLVFDKYSGRLLGAQGIGSESVAGRINVLATAITAKMTIEQVNELDLVYAPPVAPVYDPVLIAASQALKKVEKA